MCLVEDMINAPDDGVVSIKVQQFRSRHEKYVYYNYTRVSCECHAINMIVNQAEYQKMLKRLSQKIRKLQS